MNIALPKHNESIATCFDAASLFEIFVVEKGRIISSKTVQCHGEYGFQRVRLLRLYEVHTLICNGIKNFYRDQLVSLGINVISNISDTLKNAVIRFLDNQLNDREFLNKRIESNDLVSHDQLTHWAKNLFVANGYTLSVCSEQSSYLIDFIAEMSCPLCKKKIEVAICCGAQIYWLDQEIREFNHIAGNRYDARVYVYLTNPSIAKSCDEYGISFISPEMPELKKYESKYMIPILQKPIPGHEKALGEKLNMDFNEGI